MTSNLFSVFHFVNVASDKLVLDLSNLLSENIQLPGSPGLHLLTTNLLPLPVLLIWKIALLLPRLVLKEIHGLF